MVAVIERRLAARDERRRWQRDDRRRVYARFLATSLEYVLGGGEGLLTLHYAELELVAGREVRDSAYAIFNALAGDYDPNEPDFNTLRDSFVAAARRELDYRD